jgi:hypothetical protein
MTESENGSVIEGRPGARRRSRADERAVRAVELRIVNGWSYAKIGQELGIGAPGAKHAYERGVLMLVPQDDITTARQTALQKLDQWEEEILLIARAQHPLVNFGKVVFGEYDSAINLAAYDRLIKVERERRSIVGYSAPSKRVLEVINEDSFEKAIRELNLQAEALERDTELQDRLSEAVNGAS